jgi:hypothetical protein
MSTIEKPPRACAICGGGQSAPGDGQLIWLCFEHEKAWRDSPERTEAATARQRFVERVKGQP